MPASSGMRSRPQIGLMRPRSLHRLHIGGAFQAVPKGLVLPILLVAGLTFATASSWTYGIHTDESYSGIAAPEVTGTIRTDK
jgi:hypothetical protein